jgi:hypothetical protein
MPEIIDLTVTDRAYNDVRSFGTQMYNTPSKSVWFQNILTCLLDSILREPRQHPQRTQAPKQALPRSVPVSNSAHLNLAENIADIRVSFGARFAPQPENSFGYAYV